MSARWIPMQLVHWGIPAPGEFRNSLNQVQANLAYRGTVQIPTYRGVVLDMQLPAYRDDGLAMIIPAHKVVS